MNSLNACGAFPGLLEEGLEGKEGGMPCVFCLYVVGTFCERTNTKMGSSSDKYLIKDRTGEMRAEDYLFWILVDDHDSSLPPVLSTPDSQRWVYPYSIGRDRLSSYFYDDPSVPKG